MKAARRDTEITPPYLNISRVPRYLCSRKYRGPGPAATVSELLITPGKHRVQAIGGAKLVALSMPQPAAVSGHDTVTVPFPLLWMDKAGGSAGTEMAIGMPAGEGPPSACICASLAFPALT